MKEREREEIERKREIERRRAAYRRTRLMVRIGQSLGVGSKMQLT